jgi:putative transcriptional regulator
MGSVDSLRGQLIVASPSLLDPNFQRTVVLIAEHGEDGAMGIVLNRPLEAEVGEAAPPLEALVEDGDQIYGGGPVQATSVVILARFSDPADAGALIFEDVGFVAADADFEALAPSLIGARVFAGFAGWGAGQLESEMERDDWIVEQALADDVFTEDPDNLWSAVLERKGGQFALVARMPLDPSVN